jgi:hypothetical protein
MGVPLGTSFDVAEASPIDSRMTWTGNAGNLNQIAVNGANRYPGLITYVTGDQNLYVFQGNNIWEKIVTTNIDFIDVTTNSFTLNSQHNGQVLYVDNNSSNVNIFLPSTLNEAPVGYNVTIVQMGGGNAIINNSASFTFVNRLGLTRTAGQYAVASLLRIRATNNFLLYGDVV